MSFYHSFSFKKDLICISSVNLAKNIKKLIEDYVDSI